MKEGATDHDIFEEFAHCAFKYQQGIRAARTVLAPRRDPTIQPSVHIFWGASGTGKTMRAFAEFKDAYILTKPNGSGCVWFDGYKGQSTIIFDEFYGWVPYDLLLRIVDRYPLQLQIKGGFVECCATNFVFTSNRPWEEWYPNIDDRTALTRRFTEWGKIVKFEQKNPDDVNFL